MHSVARKMPVVAWPLPSSCRRADAEDDRGDREREPDVKAAQWKVPGDRRSRYRQDAEDECERGAWSRGRGEVDRRVSGVA
jgi:hypothetical protein